MPNLLSFAVFVATWWIASLLTGEAVPVRKAIAAGNELSRAPLREAATEVASKE